MARVHQHAKPVRVPEIRKGDTVVVLAGRDAGKTGTVERVIRRTASLTSQRSPYRRSTPKGGVSVVVKDVNIAKRHTKARQTQGRTDRAPKVQQGGILDIAQPMDVSKVMLICPNCKEATRVRHSVLEDGRRVRSCTHCGKAMEVAS
jgi:large subunit ribosomal protein L24